MNIFKQLLGLIFGFLLTLIVLELFLQLGEIDRLKNSKQDKLLGNSLNSNSNSLYFNEGFSIRKVNNYGYYGPSYPKEKEENLERIALIGDSYVEGIQVFERNHFRRKLEDLLNKNHSLANNEVLNFGRSGFNLNDAYCYYQNFVKKFNPSTKLIFVSPGDLINKKTSTYRPYAFVYNGNLKIDYGFNKSEKFKFIELTEIFRGKSIILGYIYKTLELVKTDNYKTVLFGKIPSVFVEKKIEAEKKKEILSDITKKIIIELRNEDCIFVVHSETTTNYYDYLLDDFLEFSKNNNVKVINLTPLFKKLKSNNINYNYWPITNKIGHFNEKGHEEISKFIYEKITNQIN